MFSFFFPFLYLAFGHNECPDPGVPINARRFGDNFQLGSSISVICEEGFIKTQGTETITCMLVDGKVMWSGLIPKCGGMYFSFYSNVPEVVTKGNSDFCKWLAQSYCETEPIIKKSSET